MLPVESDKVGQKNGNKTVVNLRGEAAQNIERIAVAEREGGPGRHGSASEPLHEGPLPETVESQPEESFFVEAGMKHRESTCEETVAGFVEPILETWCRGGVKGHGQSEAGSQTQVKQIREPARTRKIRL